MTWRGRHTHILLGFVLVGTLGGQAWAFELPGGRNQTASKAPEIGATALVHDATSELGSVLEPTFSDEHGMLRHAFARRDREWSLSVKADDQVIHARDHHERRPDVMVGLDLRPSLTSEEPGRRDIRTTDEGVVCRLQVLPIAFGVSGADATDGLVLLSF